MQDCKPIDTPISKRGKLSLNQCPKNTLEIEEIQKFPYAQVIGSLMYAQVCSRLDIAYIAGGFGSIHEHDTLEGSKMSFEIFTEDKELHAHVQKIRTTRHHWVFRF